MIVKSRRTIRRDSMVETYGQWIKQTREKLGLKGKDLAARAKVSKQYISSLERNAPHGITGAAPRPSLKVVKALAEALQVPESESMRRAGYYPEEPEVDPRTALLLSYFRELSDNERDDALALMETVYRRRERTRRIPAKGVPHERPATKSARAKKK